MGRSKSKKIKGRRKIFIIGAYWILFVALMGIFSSSIFKFSADTPSGYTAMNKTIKPSIIVKDKNSESETGQAGQFVGIKADNGKQINGKTGENGYSNEGQFDLIQKGDSVYLGYNETVVKTLYFYITDKDYNKTGKQVTRSVSPLISKDKLNNLKPYEGKDIYRLPTVVLYSDLSGGDVVGYVAANGENNAQENTGSGSTAVGVGVPIPAPGGPDEVNNAESYTFNGYICAIYYWALNIGFGLTLLMFIYAGYRYMTAAGNDSAFSETKDVLTNAILGFLLLLCIRLVLHFLNVPEPDSCFSSEGNTSTNSTSVLNRNFSYLTNQNNETIQIY